MFFGSQGDRIISNIYLTLSNIYCTIVVGGGALKNKRMKAARAEHDLSQEQLAKIVGVTRQTIGMIESGKYNPSLNLCVAICKTLNKTLDDLYWRED